MTRGRPRKQRPTMEEMEAGIASPIANSEDRSEAASVRVKERTPRFMHQADSAGAIREDFHARWVRTKPGRVRKFEQLGFRAATPEDTTRDHKGVVGNDRHIYDGDLILMVGPRKVIEERELARRQLDRDRDKQRSEQLDQLAHSESDPELHYQENKGRKYFIP